MWLAKNRYSQALLAVKKMKIKAKNERRLANELYLLQTTQHSNFVEYIDSYIVGSELWVCFFVFLFDNSCFQVKSLSSIKVLMEYMEKKSLGDILDAQGLNEVEIASVCREVCLFFIFCFF